MRSPMAWVAEFATIASFLLLCITCYALADFVMPVYVDMYAGANWQLSLPSRLAIAAGRPGILVGLFAVIMVFTHVRFRAPDLAMLRTAVGGVVNFLLILWLVGLSWVAVDFAEKSATLRPARTGNTAPVSPRPADTVPAAARP